MENHGENNGQAEQQQGQESAGRFKLPNSTPGSGVEKPK
jgi:hypothetical protein